MLERILVPLDGSVMAESVLAHIRRFLMSKDAEIILLRAVTLPPSPEVDAGVPLEELWPRATGYIESAAGMLAAQGARARGLAVEGPPAEAILEAAHAHRATMIAMSTHGRSGLSRWVFGSVTEKVIRSSTAPVLAVPSFAGIGGDAFPRGAQELPFRRLLLPVAAADLSLEAVAPAAEVARLFGAPVFLLHVCEGAECAVPVAQMKRAYELLRARGVAAEPVMRQGDAAAQILEVCREKEADLIVMTTHGHSGATRWMLGSVAEKVLRTAAVPVIAVRSAGASAGLSAERAFPAAVQT